VALNRARYFLICNSSDYEKRDLTGEQIRNQILQKTNSKYQRFYNNQLSLFN